MSLTGTVLVTGGAGFIGSHIAARLAASGARVRIIDDLSTGYLHNIEEIGGDVDFVQASLTDEEKVRKSLEGVEVIFHEAAIPSVPRSVENPRQTHAASGRARTEPRSCPLTRGWHGCARWRTARSSQRGPRTGW